MFDAAVLVFEDVVVTLGAAGLVAAVEGLLVAVLLTAVLEESDMLLDEFSADGAIGG
jgi:hypothetical protein